MFKIKGTLKPGDIKLKKNYLCDTLEIDWKEVTVTFNDNKIELPKIVAIRTWDKIKVRRNLHLRMACLLQPEFNFLHGYLRCQLPVEVLDVEVKITSMQGMHILSRDRTTQLIKYTLWSTRLCPHLTIIKKMRTFLEVEGKMGSIPQPTSGQYRPPQLDKNPNVRKDNAVEKRKRAVPTKRFRPSSVPKPSKTTAHPPAAISKAPINVKPQTDASENRPPPLEDAPVCESTPWPGAGKMSGNLFKDRNWLLPPNYLNNDNKNATGITSPKPPIKEEPKIGEQSIISPQAKIRTRKKIGMAITRTNYNRKHHPSQKYKDPKQDALKL